MNKRKEQTGGNLFMYTTIFFILVVLGLLVYIYMTQHNTKPDLYDFSPGGATPVASVETPTAPPNTLVNPPVSILGGRYSRFR